MTTQDALEALDDLELRTLEMALDGPHPALEALRRQLPTTRVSGRESTPGGFVTHLAVDDEAEPVSAPQRFQLLDVHAEMKGVRGETGFILFVEEGRLTRLEGQNLGADDWPESPRLGQLFYKHPRTPGGAELVRTAERDFAWALGPEAGFSDNDLDETAPEPINTLEPPPRVGRSTRQPTEALVMPSRANPTLSPDETQRVSHDELALAPDPAPEARPERPDEATESDPASEPGSQISTGPLATRRLMYLLATNVFLGTALSFATALLLARAEYLAPGASAMAFDTASLEARRILLAAFLTVFTAGALGAVLSNLRGLFQHSRATGGFPSRLEVPFYLRPLSGALTGFLVLMVINLTIAALTAGTATAGWATMPGRMAYAGIALVAGFAAQETLEKLRQVIRNVFGLA